MTGSACWDSLSAPSFRPPTTGQWSCGTETPRNRYIRVPTFWQFGKYYMLILIRSLAEDRYHSHICTFNMKLQTVSLAQRLKTASLALSKVNKIQLPRKSKMVNCHFHMSDLVVIKQTRCNVLISELQRCWSADFVTLGQSQASCFPLFPVFMLS